MKENEEDNLNVGDYLYNENNDISKQTGASFIELDKSAVLKEYYSGTTKQKLCCIELMNNNRIYIKYENDWQIKDLIQQIVNHEEFKKIYHTRDWLLNSENHLSLFDLHLALYRKIKNDNETKIDFSVNLGYLHNKGLLKNPKFPFFIFKDNRNNGDLIQFHEDKIEALKKIKENNYESYLLYKNFLPRVNVLNTLNCHPEFEEFYQSAKCAINQLSGYNINPLIYEKRIQQSDEKTKNKKINKINTMNVNENKVNELMRNSNNISTKSYNTNIDRSKNNTINSLNSDNSEEDTDENSKKDLDWFVYDDESMNFLTALDKEEFKLNSNISFLNKKEGGNTVLFEDIYESTKLKEKEMKNVFVNISYPISFENQNTLEKKLKLDLNTTGYDLVENMKKKLSSLSNDFDFDIKKKILKVRSLNDYVIHMDIPLSRFAYVNECVVRNTTPEYIILDDPRQEILYNEDIENNNQRETITTYMKDGAQSVNNLKKFIAISSSISKKEKNINKNIINNKNVINSEKDDLVLFIDSLENCIKEHNSKEIIETQKTIEKKEKEYLELSSIMEDKNSMMQQEESIFDDDGMMTFLQNKLGATRASIINPSNVSLLALNNTRQSILNPNVLRQSISKGVVHSIYNENTILNIINDSMTAKSNVKYVKKNHNQGPISMMAKSKSKNQTPNIFINSINENCEIYPLLIEKSLPLNIKEIQRPFSILINYFELNEIFDSFPDDSSNFTEILVFKFQINIGAEKFCKPVTIKWTNKRNKKNKIPSCPLFNKRIYFDIDYSTLPTFASLLIKIKHVKYQDGKNILKSDIVRWVNFKLFDHNRNLMTGKHKLNLHSKEFTDFSYFVFTDNITDENSSKIYFEIESFITSIYNMNFNEDSSDIKIQKMMMSEVDKKKIEEIKKKTPFDTLNNYDKQILWNNRYILAKTPEILPKLLLCVDYKNPQDVKELRKVLKMAELLTPVQSMELLTGKYLHEYIRSFAVLCLSKSSVTEIETYLIQLVQGLKYEMFHDNKLAIFLLKLSISYPLTIGHCFFWSLRSEMNNVNVQQRFGLYLHVFLSKIGPKLIKIYEDECNFMRKMYTIAQIPKNKKIKNKNVLKETFINALKEYNNEILSKNLEISMPLNFKLRIKGFVVEKCRYMKSKKKPLWLVLKNADETGNDIIVLYKSGDDLRMDIVTLQLFKIMQNLWYLNGLSLKMSIYNVISTDENEGMLEVVLNSTTLAAIHKEQGGVNESIKKNSLKNWIIDHKEGENIFENFLLSNVAYCCATFVLGIGDRHSDNIMLKKNGELFHIDFGHFLGHFKYKMGIKRERAPFVFTNQFKTVLDSEGSPGYEEFTKKYWEAYEILRKHSDVLVTLLRILICTDIPELKEKDIEYLNQSLVLNYSDEEAKEFLNKKIVESVNSWSTPINFWIHYIANK